MADKNMEAQISVEFEEATSRQSLNSGETINTLWSKVKRWLSDLKTVCFSGSYNDLSDKPTTATTETDGFMSADDKSKLDSADDTYALKSKYGDTTIDVGRKAGTTVGAYSTAEGYNTTASGGRSHAEGANTTANHDNSHAEGFNTSASGNCSHAEGTSTTASGNSSHAEGYRAIASGHFSHAEGTETTASGAYSHTSGYCTKALHDNEAAYGKYNESNDNTLFSIGDGTADNARHNAFEITTTGGKLHDKDIATADLIPNPNLLINPDFKINQRRLSSYNADWNHTVDRWVQFGAVVSPNSSGDINISKRDEADYFGFIQRTEILQSDCNGKSMTLSAKINGEVLSGTIIRSNVEQIFFNIGNSSDRFIISSYSNNDIKYIIVQLYGSKSYNIEWVKLEYGSVATPFIPPDPASELLKCQRYYQIRSMNDISTVDLCPNMRDGVVPTITALADGNYSYEAEL